MAFFTTKWQNMPLFYLSIIHMPLNIVSLFSGAGGLDLGFKQADFNIVFANEYDKDIWDTYSFNHPETPLDTRSIVNINAEDIPNCDGIIGGPPCQSWSAGGSQKGIEDPRGKLFFNFINIISTKKPKFFLAENVKGITSPKHKDALNEIKSKFSEAGYDLYVRKLNAEDYGVAQTRERIIFVGIRSDLNKKYEFPEPLNQHKCLKDIIWDLRDSAVPSLDRMTPNPETIIPNHEFLIDSFSPRFMSRNRVRSWDEPAFTVQASGRQANIHPNAPKMVKIGTDQFKFVEEYSDKYRRLSVRESARIQGFPDDFIFKYSDINDGYKMIGNAVNVEFARVLAESIKKALF